MSTLNLQPSGAAGIDTQIRAAGSANNNYGVFVTMGAGIGVSTDKGLLKFDLSSIAVGATIFSAIVTLWAILEDDPADRDVSFHRSLVEWFEGDGSASPPSGDGSTWNHRNANGSVVWNGGAGGAAGSDYSTIASDTTTITTADPDTAFDWDVTNDVQFWADGEDNYGWWIIGPADNRFVFAQSGNSTASVRPSITVEYGYLIQGNASGTSSSSAHLITNEFVQASVAGTSTVSGTMHAIGYAEANAAGIASASGDIQGEVLLSPGSSAGTAIVVAHITGVFQVSGSAAGTSTASAIADFQGHLRGSSAGIAVVSGLMWGKAIDVATVIGCNPVPLLYITDGSIKNNGQLNILNFLSEGSGFKLKDGGWRPQIAQYKEGGRFSNGPLAQGRRLRYRNFDNVIDTFELAAVSRDQDALIEFQQELLAWQEAAADYWVSDYVVSPVYLVARAARETNIRYAIIHMISIPELENPYSQPFYNIDHAAFAALTPRIERGHWLSTPPGEFECVPISSIRSWTVSGWETGS